MLFYVMQQACMVKHQLLFLRNTEISWSSWAATCMLSALLLLPVLLLLLSGYLLSALLLLPVLLLLLLLPVLLLLLSGYLLSAMLLLPVLLLLLSAVCIAPIACVASAPRQLARFYWMPGFWYLHVHIAEFIVFLLSSILLVLAA